MASQRRGERANRRTRPASPGELFVPGDVRGDGRGRREHRARRTFHQVQRSRGVRGALQTGGQRRRREVRHRHARRPARGRRADQRVHRGADNLGLGGPVPRLHEVRALAAARGGERRQQSSRRRRDGIARAAADPPGARVPLPRVGRRLIRRGRMGVVHLQVAPPELGIERRSGVRVCGAVDRRREFVFGVFRPRSPSVSPSLGDGGFHVEPERFRARLLFLVVGPVAERGVGQLSVDVFVHRVGVSFVVFFVGCRVDGAHVVLAQRRHGVDVRVLRLQRVPAELEEQGDDSRVGVRGVRAPLRATEPRDKHVQRLLLVQLRVDAEALAQGVERVVDLVRVRVRERVVPRVIHAVVVGDAEVLVALLRGMGRRDGQSAVKHRARSRAGRVKVGGYRGGIARTSTSTRRFTISPSSAETFSARLAPKLDAMMAARPPSGADEFENGVFILLQKDEKK